MTDHVKIQWLLVVIILVSYCIYRILFKRMNKADVRAECDDPSFTITSTENAAESFTEMRMQHDLSFSECSTDERLKTGSFPERQECRV